MTVFRGKGEAKLIEHAGKFVKKVLKRRIRESADDAMQFGCKPGRETTLVLLVGRRM